MKLILIKRLGTLGMRRVRARDTGPDELIFRPFKNHQSMS